LVVTYDRYELKSELFKTFSADPQDVTSWKPFSSSKDKIGRQIWPSHYALILFY